MSYILTVSYFIEPEYAVCSYITHFTNKNLLRASFHEYRKRLYFKDEKSMNNYIGSLEKVDISDVGTSIGGLEGMDIRNAGDSKKVFWDASEDMFCTCSHHTDLEKYGEYIPPICDFKNGDEVILNVETQTWETGVGYRPSFSL